MDEKQLIEENLGLVYYVVNNYYFGNEDYISLGTIGLIKGIRNYDPSKGYSLSSYLIPCIKNEIAYNYRQDKNPKDTLSLDFDSNEDGTPLINAIGDGYNLEEELIKKEENIKLFEAIDKLNVIEQYVINNYYGLHGKKKKLQKEIAFDLGLSQIKITRLHIKALRKLRKLMEER